MESTADKIVKLLKGAKPPQSVEELVARTGSQQSTVYQTISKLLAAGLITKDDMAWRRHSAQVERGRPAKNSLKSIRGRLNTIANEGGRDRVQALGMLLEIQQRANAEFGPPPPNDHAGLVAELRRQMEAAGREASDEAYDLAFSPCDTLPVEATDGQEAPHMAGPAASGGSLG